MMAAPENAGIQAELRTRRDRYAAGVNAGVEMQAQQWPEYVRQLMASSQPYERGVLLGVLLDEWHRMESHD